ncbi:MAG: serine hydrolase [Reyranella sp.]|nr:serine hydrolase [Reyranella sp.]
MRCFRVLIPVLLLTAAAVVFAAAEARAQTVAEVEQAWRGWMGRNGRTTGGLAVLHQGRVAHEAAMGRDGIGQPLPMASLSKAVTGVCIAGLIDDGRLAFDTPLSQALQRTIARLGTPADRRLLGVTIAQLLTHRAGFDPDKGGDPATAPLGAYLAKATATRTAFDEGVMWIFRRALPLPPGERYAYRSAA